MTPQHILDTTTVTDIHDCLQEMFTAEYGAVTLTLADATVECGAWVLRMEDGPADWTAEAISEIDDSWPQVSYHTENGELLLFGYCEC